MKRRAAGRCTREIARSGAPAFFLKQYLPGYREGFRSAFSQAKAEAQAFEFLGSHGFPVPRLLSWQGARGRGAYLFWEGRTGEPLDRVLEKGYPDPWKGGAWRSKTALIRAAARLVRRLHDCGRVHRDLYLCHVLFDGFRGEEPQLALIDLQRVAPRRLRRWFVKDLAALLSSCPKTVSRADKLRFLLAWEGKERIDRRTRRWARSVQSKASRILRHRPKYG